MGSHDLKLGYLRDFQPMDVRMYFYNMPQFSEL